MVADAKALQHILHTSGYRYPKSPLIDRTTKDLLGNGLDDGRGDAVTFVALQRLAGELQQDAAILGLGHREPVANEWAQK